MMYVYLISHWDDGIGVGPVKIGISAQPWARLAELQTGNPRKLAICMCVACDGREAAGKIEQGLHSSLAAHRMAGEWFDLNVGCALIHFIEFLTGGPIHGGDEPCPLYPASQTGVPDILVSDATIDRHVRRHQMN